MSSDEFIELARQDLAALERTRREAMEKAALASKSIYGPAGLNAIRRQQVDAYREIASEPFSVRIDAEKDGDPSSRFYLTKARQGIQVDGLTVISWTAPLARLRLLDLGEEDDIVAPGGEHTYVLKLKAKFQPTTDDLENGRYESTRGVYAFPSAKRLVSGLAANIRDLPVTTPRARNDRDQFGLREIIFDTDRAQDDQLRMPMRGHLVIEGAPGSGKTSIALQRAVYVIEQQYDELGIERENPFFTDDTTLVVTYNEILVYYLERLLKELRIPQVPVKALSNWTKEILDGAHALSGVRREKKKDSRPLSILKTHPSILVPLKKWTTEKLIERWQLARSQLAVDLRDIFGRASNTRSAKYLNELGIGEQQLRNGSIGLSHLVALFRIVRDEYIREPDSQEANAVRSAIQRCASAIVDYGALYLSFLQSDEFRTLAQQLVDSGVLKPTGAEEAVREARAHAHEGFIRKYDLPLIAWIVRWLADDVPSTPVVQFTKPWIRYSHLIMDEVQDLSPIECRLLLEIVDPRYRCVTAVGDLMQRLNYPAGLPNWADGGFILNGADGRLGLFKKNYRQTTELGRLAEAYYRAHWGEPVPFEPRSDLSGKRPVILIGADTKSRLVELATEIIELRKANPSWSVVVLCEDDELRETAARILKPPLRENHIQCRRSKAVELRDRSIVHISPTLQTKGLEFDCVCLLEPGRGSKKMSQDQLLRSAYVALTRAARHLIVTSSKHVPQVLAPVASHFAHKAVR